MYIDTHAHLDFDDYREDLDQVIKRAQKAGVEKIITVGIDFESSHKAIKIAHRYENVYATVSLHPTHAEGDFDFEEFKKLAQDKKIVAIGETGLDYKSISKEQLTINKSANAKASADKQKELFESFIKMARELDKPLIVHSRESEDEVLKMLKLHKMQKMRGVMHCFPGDWTIAQKVIDLGFLISFTGLVTYNLSKKTREVIEKAPLEKIMIETDCPFMTPLKQRLGNRDQGLGKRVRNEPAYVVEVAQIITEIKNIPLKQVAQQTTQNANRLFKISKL